MLSCSSGPFQKDRAENKPGERAPRDTKAPNSSRGAASPPGPALPATRDCASAFNFSIINVSIFTNHLVTEFFPSIDKEQGTSPFHGNSTSRRPVPALGVTSPGLSLCRARCLRTAETGAPPFVPTGRPQGAKIGVCCPVTHHFCTQVDSHPTRDVCRRGFVLVLSIIVGIIPVYKRRKPGLEGEATCSKDPRGVREPAGPRGCRPVVLSCPLPVPRSQRPLSQSRGLRSGRQWGEQGSCSPKPSPQAGHAVPEWRRETGLVHKQ